MQRRCFQDVINTSTIDVLTLLRDESDTVVLTDLRVVKEQAVPWCPMCVFSLRAINQSEAISAQSEPILGRQIYILLVI